jgi:predicted transcriptional regulator
MKIMAENEDAEDTLLTLTADIVAAHVSNNSVAVNDIPSLIQNVHQALTKISADRSAAGEKPEPKVSIPIVGEAGLHRLPRMRKKAEDAQKASDDQP